jgi:hypothetical protein
MQVLQTTRPSFYIPEHFRYVHVKRPLPKDLQASYWPKSEEERVTKGIVAKWQFQTIQPYGGDLLTYTSTVEAIGSNLICKANPHDLAQEREQAARLLQDPARQRIERSAPLLGVPAEKDRRLSKHRYVDLNQVSQKLMDWIMPCSEIWAGISLQSTNNGQSIDKYLESQRNSYLALPEFVDPKQFTQAKPRTFDQFVSYIRREHYYLDGETNARVECTWPRPALTIEEAKDYATPNPYYIEQRHIYQQDLLYLCGLLQNSQPLLAAATS